MPAEHTNQKRAFQSALRGTVKSADITSEEQYGKFYNVDIQAFSSHYHSLSSMFPVFLIRELTHEDTSDTT
jgi:hypothetical protein